MCSVLAWAFFAAAGAGPLEDALALERSGDPVRALALLEQLVRRDPTSPLARIEAARLRLKLGKDLERAEMDLEAARSLAPENPRAHYLWGLLMEERGRRADAIQALELALLYRPDYADARFQLAGDYFSEGNWAQAETHYRTLCKLNSDSTQARLQLAATLEKEGKLHQAEDELRHLLAEQPRSGLFRRKLGEFYARTNRAELAAKMLDAPKRKMRELNKSSR